MSDYTTADAYPVIAEQDMDLPSGAHVRVRRPSMFMMLRRGQVPAEVREIVARIDAAREREAETGEPMEVVGKVLPLAPSNSNLPWSVDTLRFCNWCDQLAQKDLNDCPTCGRRMAALPRP